MSDADEDFRRVRFYGARDLATGMYVERVAELIEKFDAAAVPATTADVIELHNVQQYIENGFLPHPYTPAQRDLATSLVPAIRGVVARFFSAVDNSNCAAVVDNISFNYREDLLELLGRNKAFERCDAATMLPALDDAGVHLGELLACKKLVAAYDAEMRDLLLASPRNAEHLVRKYLQRNVRERVHLPASFAPADARDLLERYLDYPEANPNYVGLIESASSQVTSATGIDAKLRLRAKRRSAEMTQKFFENNTGFRTGAEVGLSDTQDEPAQCEMDDSDGLVARFTYSSRWLEDTLEYPSILNNFQYLFEFADRQVLLTLPSYPAQLGVFERLLFTTGKTDYQTGAAFRAVEMSSLLQTRLYQHYLETKDIDMEEVIAWFFNEYLATEFGARNFSFAPSTRGASYLEKARHLFVENGELDPDLLATTSDPALYRQVPSLLEGKYVYATDGDEITGILHILFSDQSTLNYISEDLKGDDVAGLLIDDEVAYNDFHEFQQRTVDELVNLGILENTGTRVRIANPPQFLILRSMFTTEAASYFHLSETSRAEVPAMEARGWVTRRSTLLTETEGKYLNFLLNKVDFGNGPELRNKYLHGSQANADGEDAHFQTYITALKLMMALIIKVNDDFCLSATEQSGPEKQSEDPASDEHEDES